MNKVELMGRLTKDPDVKPAQDNSTSVTRYTLAVDRRRSKKTEEEQTADFINLVAFKNQADFLEKFGKKGTKFIVIGRIQSGSYEKDGTLITACGPAAAVEFAKAIISLLRGDEVTASVCEKMMFGRA